MSGFLDISRALENGSAINPVVPVFCMIINPKKADSDSLILSQTLSYILQLQGLY